jgi:hypothetical protein
MPYVYKFEQPANDENDEEAEEECFTCNLRKERCIGINRNGQRCKRETCIGTNYCFQHLESIKHLKIRKSTIPNAGKGLYAWDSKLPPDAMIFRTGDKIIEYRGDRITDDNTLTERYGEYTAPYSCRVNKNLVIDSGCNRGVGSMANSSHGTILHNNATLRSSNVRGGGAYLQCTRNIRNKQEILLSYGGNYRFNEPTKQSTKYKANR